LYQWGRTYRYHYPWASKQGIPFLNRALDLARTIDARALEARDFNGVGRRLTIFARHYTEAQHYLHATISLKEKTRYGKGKRTRGKNLGRFDS
jgi:BioD-like phosphotransacetylase family protein